MLLFLESFYGGSHRAFADAYCAATRFRTELVTLPAERWRQRTRAAAFHFARAVERPDRFEAVLVTDLIDLADLCAIWRDRSPPLLLYMHESQATYPLPKGKSPSVDDALRDIKNALHADRVLFNSRFHRSHFMERAASALEEIEQLDREETLEQISQKSSVVYPGIAPVRCTAQERYNTRTELGVDDECPLIVWNHRWEYDKQPHRFFRALRTMREHAVQFKLCVLGENPQHWPREFEEARAELADQLVHYGFEPDQRRYRRLLAAGDIAVSTAIQENFGIAVAEAISAGCYPLLPNRLSYPELVPAAHHPGTLYNSPRELVTRLRQLLTVGVPEHMELAASMERFSTTQCAEALDAEVEALRG